VFLGERALTDVPAISAALCACAKEPMPLRVGGALWLAPRHPHVLTVAIDDPAGTLDAVHRRIEAVLVESVKGYEAERRAFRPHVTVARLRRGARTRPSPLDAPAPARFTATALALYRSRPGAGSQYEALARAPLPRPG
jgi:2'-5' RNA ligase